MRVGVTGHRRLDHPRETAAAIREILQEIQGRFAMLDSSGVPAPLLAISPLAEGADRLVAREILALEGGMLEAVLPLDVEDYCRDFESEDSPIEFAALLDSADPVTVLETAPDRGSAYEAAGRRVVDSCDILIAVWDGDPARGRGGTAEAVAYARETNRPIYLIDSTNPRNWTREGVPDNTGQEPMNQNEIPAGQIDHIADLKDIKQALEDSIAAAGTAGDESTASILRGRLNKVMAHFGPNYGQAGDQAEYFQSKYRQTSIAIFVLATLAVLIVASQSIFHLSHWIIAGEFAAITFILGIIFMGNRRGWHMAWLENRLEAEWFRHALFVAFLSGQTIPGIDRHWACRWVSKANGVTRVRNVWNDLPVQGMPPAAGLEILKDFMKKAWLEDQISYHSAKSHREIEKHERISKAGEAAFWLTFIAAGLHLIPHSVYHKWHLPDEPIVRSLTILAIGLPAIGAAFAGLRAHFEYKKIAARSAMMAEHLGSLKLDLDSVKTIDQLGVIVQETETLMLQENSDWYFTIGLHELEKG